MTDQICELFVSGALIWKSTNRMLYITWFWFIWPWSPSCPEPTREVQAECVVPVTSGSVAALSSQCYHDWKKCRQNYENQTRVPLIQQGYTSLYDVKKVLGKLTLGGLPLQCVPAAFPHLSRNPGLIRASNTDLSPHPSLHSSIHALL